MRIFPCWYVHVSAGALGGQRHPIPQSPNVGARNWTQISWKGNTSMHSWPLSHLSSSRVLNLIPNARALSNFKQNGRMMRWAFWSCPLTLGWRKGLKRGQFGIQGDQSRACKEDKSDYGNLEQKSREQFRCLLKREKQVRASHGTSQNTRVGGDHSRRGLWGSKRRLSSRCPWNVQEANGFGD